jgi:hypothetical protein
MSQIKTKFIEDLAVTTAKINTDAVTTAKILDANVTNAKVATGIDAVKIADGTVTNAEFQFINSLTSNAQTQLNGKANVTLSNLTSPTAINQHLTFDMAGFSAVRTKDLSAATETIIVESGNVTGAFLSGQATVRSGTSSGAATGDVTLISGDAETVSGNTIVQTGIADTANSGDVQLTTGDATTLDSGNINLTTGSAGNDSGNITLTTGTGTNERGAIYHVAPTTLLQGDGSTAQVLRFYEGNNGNYAGIRAPTLAADYTLTLPTDDGTASQVLTTDGAGVLSWTTPASGETRAKQTFVLNGTDITNQFITLSNAPAANSVHFMVKGAGSLLEGASYDYSVSGAQVNFLNDLATGGGAALIAGDVVQVQYEY